MKRSFLKKAGTVLLSTATGFSCLSTGISFGQDPVSSGAEIQRRLAEMYAREGKPVPSRQTASKATPQAPQQRPTLRVATPAQAPAVRSGITAPVTESFPVVTAAKPASALPAKSAETHSDPFPQAESFPHTQSFPETQAFPEIESSPRAERWPNTDPAPPVPAITPGPSSHPLASATPAEEAAFPEPSVVHPLAENETSAPAASPESAFPQEHPLAGLPVPGDSSFEMPVFVEQTEGKPQQTKTVLTPPIAPQEALDELEAEWQRQVQLELTKPTPDQVPNSIPLAPPAVSESENPFEDFPTEAQSLPIAKTATAPKEAPEHSPIPKAEIEQTAAQAEPVSPRPAEFQPIETPAAPQVVGLGGCCPVTLRDNRIQVPGRADHQSEFQGVVYRLASAEAKQQFDAHPEQYAPVHGGCDVTLTSQEGQEVPGTLEHAIWYRKQLYLFRDAQSLKTFTVNPSKYMK